MAEWWLPFVAGFVAGFVLALALACAAWLVLLRPTPEQQRDRGGSAAHAPVPGDSPPRTRIPQAISYGAQLPSRAPRGPEPSWAVPRNPEVQRTTTAVPEGERRSLPADSPGATIPRLEQLTREFLAICDERSVELAEVQRWFRERGVLAESLESGPDWGILQVSSGQSAVVAPAVRRPMGAFPLSSYFHFVNYNGVQPISASMVVRLGVRRWYGDKWGVPQKGEIHG